MWHRDYSDCNSSSVPFIRAPITDTVCMTVCMPGTSSRNDFTVTHEDEGSELYTHGPGKTFNSAAGLPARVQIPVPTSATSRLLYELLGRVRLGCLVVSPFELHVNSSAGTEAEAQSEYGVVTV
jgi:hypothetical protein